MKAHDILGIETSASIDEIERAYQAKYHLLSQINPENSDEKLTLERKMVQLLSARDTCLEHRNKPMLQRVASETYQDFINPNKMRSCACIPPGLGWCCAKICDTFFSSCCCNDNPDSYNTCGDPTYPGMDPTINWFRVADALGWICCIAIAFPFIQGICGEIGSKKEQKRKAAEEKRRAEEAELRRRQEEEEKKKREEERLRKFQEKVEVDGVLAKTYTFFNQMVRRRDNVLFSMRLLNEVSPNTELERVISAYEQQLKEDALSVKRIVDELRTKPGFKEGCASFVSTYSSMFDYVDKL